MLYFIYNIFVYEAYDFFLVSVTSMLYNNVVEIDFLFSLFSLFSNMKNNLICFRKFMFQFLCRVHEGRKSYQIQECPHLSEERILCIGSSRKRPVLKWENNVAWPGKLTLTDKAMYFEVFILNFIGTNALIHLSSSPLGNVVNSSNNLICMIIVIFG